MRTGNGFCLQLRCEQSRVLLGLSELRLLVGEEADSASAGQPICAALQHSRFSAGCRKWSLRVISAAFLIGSL